MVVLWLIYSSVKWLQNNCKVRSPFPLEHIPGIGCLSGSYTPSTAGAVHPTSPKSPQLAPQHFPAGGGKGRRRGDYCN